MTVEELLKPRYEVIADYPGNTWNIGDIISPLSKESLYYLDPVGCELRNKMLSKYPLIFRPLAWYEKRDVSEMPEFLKFVWDERIDDVIKVKEWLHGNTYKEEREKIAPITGFTHVARVDSTLFPRVSLNGWTPATETEYNNHNKVKDNE